MTVHSTIDDMWLYALNQVLHCEVKESRDGDAREMIAYNATLKDIRWNWLCNRKRKASATYAAAELLWYLSGSSDGRVMRHYAPQYERFLEPDGKTANGAYGARWMNPVEQIPALLKLLNAKPLTRQAILNMWRPEDLLSAACGNTPDIPCTLSLQFLARDGFLHCICTMRSNDLWFGFPYDIWCFTTLQKLLAAELRLSCGTYTHQVGSIHLYERHMQNAKDAFALNTTRNFMRTQVCESDMLHRIRVAVRRENVSRLGWNGWQHDVDQVSILHEAAALCTVHNGGATPPWLDTRLL